MRISLAQALFIEPTLLLLDEVPKILQRMRRVIRANVRLLRILLLQPPAMRSNRGMNNSDKRHEQQ